KPDCAPRRTTASTSNARRGNSKNNFRDVAVFRRKRRLPEWTTGTMRLTRLHTRPIFVLRGFMIDRTKEQSSRPSEAQGQRENTVNQGAQGNSSSPFAAPSISLPKGGGAIRGIGEKFAANLVTGAGSMTVPIAVSTGRSGFGSQLALSYDSGAGNGPFELGWKVLL